MSDCASIAIATVFCILVIVGIVGNSLVCAILKRNRVMRTPINYLLLNLAVADILFAAFITPKVFFKLSFTHHPDGVIGTVLCKLVTSGPVAWIGAISSFVTLAVIAIERYYAVVYPLRNKGKLTKHKLKVIISGSWIFSLIFNIPPFLAWKFDKKGNSCVFNWPEEWMRKAHLEVLKWDILIGLTLLVMVVMYSRVVYTLWFKRNHDNQLNHQQRVVMRVRKRVTLVTVSVSAIFGICWGTNAVVCPLKYAAFYNIGPVPVAFSDTMVLFNSAVNPFVYALLSQQFREKFKRTICCTASSALRVHPTRELQTTELAKTGPTQQVQVARSEGLK